VDNNSIDGSVEMVKEKFPNVVLIENKDNAGFSKANNQAIKLAQGKHVLLLNPDTVVEEDTFLKIIDFMNKHPEAGGLGVKMIDGKGVFLPESKRGLPTPAVAFYKIFGLSKLFPKSKKFGKYHLSYLNKDEVHEVEILSGAFMWMRKEAIDKVGMLDEAFFMYGEDIDLSYRIILGGFKNYYFPETRIIHYKGESTKKSSVNYVFVFYNAMIIFARKHFSQKNAKLFSFLIHLAIYFRASIALMNRMIKKIFLPIFDLSFLIGGLYGITYLYQNYTEKIIPSHILKFGLSIYAIIWLFSQIFSGTYDKPIKIFKPIKGAVIGTGIILVIYALLSKDYQFSRLIILFGGAWVLFYYVFSRIILHFTFKDFKIGGRKNKKIAIVGDEEEVNRVKDILLQTTAKMHTVFYVSHTQNKLNADYVGTFNQLDQVIEIKKIDEIIFCAKNISAEQIISQMLILDDKDIEFKISQPESSFIIGSNSIDSQGDLYVMDINQVNKPANIRNKRWVDFLLSLLILVFSPILMWFFKNKKQLFSNLLMILVGKLSFVGYAQIRHESNLKLPKIKKGVLSTLDQLKNQSVDATVISRLNLIYAKNQSVLTDLKIIFSHFLQLDR